MKLKFIILFTVFVNTFSLITYCQTPIWEKLDLGVWNCNNSIRIGNHPSGYLSFYQKFSVVGEGTTKLNIWFKDSHPFSIIGKSNILLMGTDSIKNTAYIHSYNFKTNRSSDITLNPYNGNVIIGNDTNSNSNWKLTVYGGILCKRIKVTSNFNGADFVFDPLYKNYSIKELENFVQLNRHLPSVPTSTAMKNDGIEIEKMNILLLQKIEELTLYIIELNKRIEILENNNNNKNLNNLVK